MPAENGEALERGKAIKGMIDSVISAGAVFGAGLREQHSKVIYCTSIRPTIVADILSYYNSVVQSKIDVLSKALREGEKLAEKEKEEVKE